MQQKLIENAPSSEIAKKVMIEKVKPVTNTLTKVEFHLNSETLEQLKKLSELKSNQLKDKTKLSDLVELLVKEEVKRFEKRLEKVEKRIIQEQKPENNAHARNTLAGNLNQKKARPYTSTTKENLLLTKASYQCQFPGCTARKYLHIDHVIPFSKNGSSELHNLEILCSNHNLRKGNKLKATDQS